MTTQSEPGSVDQPKNDEGASTPDVAKLQEDLNKVVQERDSWKVKHRELEQTAKEAKNIKKQLDDLLVEKSTLAEQFDAYKESIRQEKLSTHLSTALEAAGAKNSATVMKLLDKSKLEFGEDGNVTQPSVVAMIEAVKTSDPYLFKEAEEDPKKGTSTSTTGTSSLPVPKRAADVVTEDAFTTELKAAQKAKDPFAAIEQVLRKYGKN